MFCMSCGTKAVENAKYCSNCGEVLLNPDNKSSFQIVGFEELKKNGKKNQKIRKISAKKETRGKYRGEFLNRFL